jgi:hypothetical protein
MEKGKSVQSRFECRLVGHLTLDGQASQGQQLTEAELSQYFAEHPTEKFFSVLPRLLEEGVISKSELGNIETHTSSFSDDGEKAVFAYTMETSLYKTINTALRKRSKADLERRGTKQYILILRTYMLKNAEPQSAEYFFRGVPCKAFDVLDARSRYTEWSFMSTSANKETAKGFAGQKEERTLMWVAAPWGFRVPRKLSQFPNEEELIIVPGTVFEVKEYEFRKELTSTIPIISHFKKLLPECLFHKKVTYWYAFEVTGRPQYIPPRPNWHRLSCLWPVLPLLFAVLLSLLLQ